MRKDKNIEDAIAWDQAQEDLTACCIRNDGSGCVQTPEKECSVRFSQPKYTIISVTFIRIHTLQLVMMDVLA